MPSISRHLKPGPVLALFCLCATLLGAPPAPAADTPTAAPQPAVTPSQQDMAVARAAIAAKRWNEALAPLQRVVKAEPGNADAHNLLGYSYRWLNRMDESFASYEQALSIDPRHRGAHEYIGVAYLKVGKIDKAEQHLQRLNEICGANCEETRDLAAAIAKAKAAKG